MANDKIIRFPGSVGRAPAADEKSDKAEKAERDGQAGAAAALGPDGLTEDQRKAVQLVLSGVSFVLIGIKPTDRGADFFTAVHGDATDLRNSQPHLDGVIARAFSKKNI